MKKRNLTYLSMLFLFGISRGALADTQEIKNGFYSVPVPQALAGLATFPVQYLVKTDDRGLKSLSYTLPSQLTGEKVVKIHLKQKESDENDVLVDFEEANGLRVASCKPSTGKLTCLVTYPGLKLDPEKTAKFLDKDGVTPPSDFRKRIAQLFSADPRGIINY